MEFLEFQRDFRGFAGLQVTFRGFQGFARRFQGVSKRFRTFHWDSNWFYMGLRGLLGIRVNSKKVSGVMQRRFQMFQVSRGIYGGFTHLHMWACGGFKKVSEEFEEVSEKFMEILKNFILWSSQALDPGEKCFRKVSGSLMSINRLSGEHVFCSIKLLEATSYVC